MNIENKRIILVGGSGLIGRHLVKMLLSKGYHPIVLSRNPEKAKSIFSNKVEVQQWDGKDTERLSSLINGTKGVINLAGETIAVRWTKKNKESIIKSRIDTTNTIASAILKCESPPEVLVQGSAIGFYNHNSSDQVDESSNPGNGFLSQVVILWEKAAMPIEGKCRLVIVRTGIVLSNDGGFLSSIVPTIKFFLGGWFGNGKQFVSWIHIDDYAKAIQFLLENKNCQGAYNLVSPNPVNSKKLVKEIGKKLHRPIWIPIPKFILKILLGNMVDEVILSNQFVIPKRLNDTGFVFKYNQIELAVKETFINKI